MFEIAVRSGSIVRADRKTEKDGEQQPSKRDAVNQGEQRRDFWIG